MHKLRNLKSFPVLMVLTILAIAAFQYYWLQKAYEREERSLERQANMYFAETVYALQASKLKLDRIVTELSAMTNNRPNRNSVVLIVSPIGSQASRSSERQDRT